MSLRVEIEVTFSGKNIFIGQTLKEIEFKANGLKSHIYLPITQSTYETAWKSTKLTISNSNGLRYADRITILSSVANCMQLFAKVEVVNQDQSTQAKTQGASVDSFTEKETTSIPILWDNHPTFLPEHRYNIYLDNYEDFFRISTLDITNISE